MHASYWNTTLRQPASDRGPGLSLRMTYRQLTNTAHPTDLFSVHLLFCLFPCHFCSETVVPTKHKLRLACPCNLPMMHSRVVYRYTSSHFHMQKLLNFVQRCVEFSHWSHNCKRAGKFLLYCSICTLMRSNDPNIWSLQPINKWNKWVCIMVNTIVIIKVLFWLYWIQLYNFVSTFQSILN